MRHFLLASLLLATAASTAAAQPSATGAPAPTTHDWSDVSHINGQLVPVGEANSYVKDFRRTNISSNPIGWMVGFYGVSVSHAITDHIAIRGDVNYIRPVDTDLEMTEFGIGAPIYLRRAYQGAFLEPGVIVRHSSEGSGDYHDRETTVGPQALFGWHWTWDSGFNVAVAAGLGRDLGGDDEGEYETDQDVFFNGYFRVGYAF